MVDDPLEDEYGGEDAMEKTQRAGIESPLRFVVVTKFQIRVNEGPDAGQDRVMEGPSLRVGSHPENDLVLTDSLVSKKHFVIERKSDGFILRDLGSTNGTIVNGVGVNAALTHERPGRTIAGCRCHFRGWKQAPGRG